MRNLVKRAATGVPVLVGLLALIAWGPSWLLAAAIAVAGCFGTYEFHRLVSREDGASPSRFVLVGGAALIGLGAMAGSPTAMGGGLFAAVLAALVAAWFRPGGKEGNGLWLAGISLAGLLIVPWLLNHAGLLLRLPQGHGLAAFLVVAVTFNDTLAYLVGTLLGRRLLLPSVSPRKTVEGALGGLAGGALAAPLASLWLRGGEAPLALGALVVLGLTLALAAQGGDLLESKLKRLSGADESGRFLPGHGGWLDRLDAYLVAAPLLYYLLLLRL